MQELYTQRIHALIFLYETLGLALALLYALSLTTGHLYTLSNFEDTLLLTFRRV